jgi:purine-nucleoside phosphorylase
MNYEAIAEAAEAVARTTRRDRHHVAAVLGSGLGRYAETIPRAEQIPYEDIPGFPVPKVEGHSGTLISAERANVNILVFAGRSHYYEGHPLDDIVFGVRTAVMAGCSTVLLTNAAGGAGPHLSPGDLVLIRDHINLTGASPLFGPNDERLGPRFPDMTNAYDRELRALAHQIGDELGIALGEGVYAWFPGPTYETPAEVEMARRLGADLVGMSTVPETIAAHHMGARVLGISLVTNLAAGISPTPLSHEEVRQAAEEARERFTTLVDALLPRLAG